MRRRAIHTLNESRKELQPLYDVLRRSSAIAHGASLALGRLRQIKLDDWIALYVPQAARASIECPPTDGVLKRTIHHVVAFPPQPPPPLSMQESKDTPADYVRLLWLNALPDALRADLPVKDLTAWMVGSFPEKGTADALLGLGKLLFDPELEVSFKHSKPKAYRTRDGVLEAATISISKP